MFAYRNDPGTDGVGIACFDAVAPDGGRLDLSLSVPGAFRSSDWDQVESELGVPCLNVHQVHGRTVLTVDAATSAVELAGQEADALVTTSRGLGLAVRAADCLPVLFADVHAEVIGAAHAGRAGLAAGVLLATVERMAELGARRLTAWIGPHICGECYEVPEELQREFTTAHPAALATTSWGTPSLDLGAAAAAQLESRGVQVIRVDPCTRTTPSLHSYRRDAAASGRQAGVVWLP